MAERKDLPNQGMTERNTKNLKENRICKFIDRFIFIDKSKLLKHLIYNIKSKEFSSFISLF